MKKKADLLTTQRLTMHALRECDEEQMLAILCSDQIKKTYMLPDFPDTAQARALFRRLMEFSLSDSHFVYGIYLEQKLIGLVNDCEIDQCSAELGYAVLPEHQGQGYASEAVRACIEELFRMGIMRVTAGFFEDNHPSRRVMEKCGMHRIAQEENIAYRGVVRHCLYYGIEKEVRPD